MKKRQQNLPILHDAHDQMYAGPHSYPLQWKIQSLITGLTFSSLEIHCQGLPTHRSHNLNIVNMVNKIHCCMHNTSFKHFPQVVCAKMFGTFKHLLAYQLTTKELKLVKCYEIGQLIETKEETPLSHYFSINN